MKLVHTVAELREEVAAAKAQGLTIGLVPTMGALHEGHASLIKAANMENDFVVVSVFVNPTQFGPNEDLDAYPRTLEADCKLAESMGANVVFAPAPKEMYPSEDATWVEVTGDITKVLCGRYNVFSCPKNLRTTLWSHRVHVQSDNHISIISNYCRQITVNNIIPQLQRIELTIVESNIRIFKAKNYRLIPGLPDGACRLYNQLTLPTSIRLIIFFHGQVHRTTNPFIHFILRLRPPTGIDKLHQSIFKRSENLRTRTLYLRIIHRKFTIQFLGSGL